MFDHAIGQLQSLASEVSESELQAAKNTLKVSVLRGLENPSDRLNETLRNINTFGRPVHGDYINWINNVTTSDVQNAITELISSTPTIVAQGAQASTLNTNF